MYPLPGYEDESVDCDGDDETQTVNKPRLSAMQSNVRTRNSVAARRRAEV